MASHGPVCGDTLATDTTLDSDLDCSDPEGTALVIGANGVSLDCRGHTISSGGGGTGVELDGVTGVTVRNCTVAAFRIGVSLFAADGNTIGFRVVGSNDNTLKQNTATDNQFGFELRESDGNTLKKNTARENGSHGFRLQSSLGNALTGNVAEKNVGFGYADADPFGVMVGSNSYSDNTCKKNGSGGSDPTGLCTPQP